MLPDTTIFQWRGLAPSQAACWVGRGLTKDLQGRHRVASSVASQDETPGLLSATRSSCSNMLTPHLPPLSGSQRLCWLLDITVLEERALLSVPAHWAPPDLHLSRLPARPRHCLLGPDLSSALSGMSVSFASSLRVGLTVGLHL